MALQAGTMHCTIEYAQSLQDGVWLGKESAPYCVVRCGDQALRTRTAVDGGKSPVWNETFRFNCTNDNGMEVEIKVEDASTDHIIGAASFSLAKARETGTDRVSAPVLSKESGEQQGILVVSLSWEACKAALRPSASAPQPQAQPEPAEPQAPYPSQLYSAHTFPPPAHAQQYPNYPPPTGPQQQPQANPYYPSAQPQPAYGSLAPLQPTASYPSPYPPPSMEQSPGLPTAASVPVPFPSASSYPPVPTAPPQAPGAYPSAAPPPPAYASAQPLPACHTAPPQHSYGAVPQPYAYGPAPPMHAGGGYVAAGQAGYPAHGGVYMHAPSPMAYASPFGAYPPAHPGMTVPGR